MGKVICSSLRAILLGALLVISQQGFSVGIIIPRVPEQNVPELRLVNADAAVTKDIARTRLTQVFHNPSQQILEADYYFPVPPEASITDFVLFINGKPVQGEVLSKTKAGQLYREIVRKVKDPGLLDWFDKTLFRVRIFPIPAGGDIKLEIELTQPLHADQGYFRYELSTPDLKSHQSQNGPLNVTYTLRLEDDKPLRNIYSPTHPIAKLTSDPKSCLITAESRATSPGKSFIVYWQTSSEDISLSLLTHRNAGADGYFSLRISPPWDQNTTVVAGDYVFILDSSGSMAGAKLEQAKRALQYCVNLLRETDRVNLIRFSTGVEPWQADMVPATRVNKEAAFRWIESIEARGGTNISEALQEGMAFRKPKNSSESDRLYTALFITDGLPTVGETSPENILNAAERLTSGSSRIFTFGVGADVNTRLLDQLAESTRATSDYVSPDADMEVPISRLFDKISKPVLTNVELLADDIQAYEIYPSPLPDLFFGTELSVFGRYKNPVSTTITLSGTINGQKTNYDSKRDFDTTSSDNAFIKRLWATRKVGYLLDEIRKPGSSEELLNEVELLAKQYAIVTPYTSILVTEDDQSPPSTSPGPHIEADHARLRPLTSTKNYSQDVHVGSSTAYTGAPAVAYARKVGEMKSSEVSDSEINVTQAAGKTIVFKANCWTDSAILGNEPFIQVKYLSRAWFDIVEKFPQYREIFALGKAVKIKLPNSKILVIGDEGAENIEVIGFESLGIAGKSEI